jgi:alkanesulfonate monooxygenase SsuD/methylene tetrahydromethanopterin reductase-like flavin-dependent oxidoreductase (luciferase family)
MIGQRFPDTGKERRQILRETIQSMKLMWSEESAYFEGEHIKLNGAIMSPKPVQKPHPPIYIACNTSRRLMPRMAAEHGNGLAIMWGHDPTVATTVKAFQEEWEAFNRNPEEYAALRSAAIIFNNDDDYDRGRKFEIEITGFPSNWELQASPAKVPEGSDPELFIVGKPSTIAEELNRRVFGMGFNQLMCGFVACDDVKIDTEGIPGWPGNYLGAMRLFVDEVLPLLE